MHTIASVVRKRLGARVEIFLVIHEIFSISKTFLVFCETCFGFLRNIVVFCETCFGFLRNIVVFCETFLVFCEACFGSLRNIVVFCETCFGFLRNIVVFCEIFLVFCETCFGSLRNIVVFYGRFLAVSKTFLKTGNRFVILLDFGFALYHCNAERVLVYIRIKLLNVCT